MPDQAASPASPARRIFTATLILGVPGAGKTSLLASFARYLWDSHQRVLLLYSWDGGAIPTDLQKLMKQGLIRFWRCRTRSAEGLAIETLYQATKGYWPREINNVTGETSPGVDLVPPVTTLYTLSCRKTGELLATLPTRGVITPTYCAACKTLHPQGELNVAETVKRTPGFEMVGGVAFDGLTSMTNEVLSFMDHARGAGQVGGEKSAFGGVVISGSVKLGGTNRADIGLGQSRGREFVNNSLSIPHLVEGPVFTGLSMEATDEGGLPIVGCKLPGRAATDEASSWFGNVYEMGKTTDEAGKEHFTLFLRPFTDAQNRRHLLKTSSSPTGLPDMLIDPIGQPWAQANLGLVFSLLDQDLQKALAEDIPGAPGLSQTPSRYGETFSVTPSAAAPAAAATAAAAAPATLPGLTPPAPGAMPAPPSASAPPVATARKRPQPAAASAVAVAEPPPTPPEPVASGLGVPPPGMRPPAKLLSS